MNQKAGILFLSRDTERLMLILENQKWTVPTFSRIDSLLADAQPLLDIYSKGKMIPVELYLSQDRGFEYGTYICLVDHEFLNANSVTQAWCSMINLPPNLHTGLKSTLSNKTIRTKISTILELENVNRK